MNKLIRLYFFIAATIFSLTGFCQGYSYDPTRLYSISELQTDFKFLQTTLENTHPNLYLYTPKEELNTFFDSLYKCIVKPLSELDFYNLITLINSKVKDGHTMSLPSEEAVNYANENAQFFPFHISISDDRLYVSMNCSADTSIHEGAEILRINGRETKDILNYLLNRQIRDGNNQTYPIWILTNYFKEYYSFSFGHPDTFAITYKTSKSINLTKTINALPKDSIRFYRRLKYLKRDSISNGNQGITLEIDKQSSIATLVIKSFNSDILKSDYKQDFDSTIKLIFNQLHEEQIQNLILDIRNNQGGDFEPGKLLLSYLLRQPIKYLHKSVESEIITPKQNGFKGKLCVLINGGSFSSTAILCSYLEMAKRGVFIGEETAGNKIIISGNSIDTILPNTKISFTVSTTKYIIRDEYNSGHGVIPTYRSTSTIDDLMLHKDTIKDLAIKIISKKKK